MRIHIHPSIQRHSDLLAILSGRSNYVVVASGSLLTRCKRPRAQASWIFTGPVAI